MPVPVNLSQRDIDSLSNVDLAVLAAQYQIRHLFSVIGLILESILSTIFSIYRIFFPDEPLDSNHDRDSSLDRSKGEAVVIWAATHDQIARRLALRLAAATPSSFAFSDSGASMASAKPPYTCIVLLSDPGQLPFLVAEWAAKKAEVEAQWETNHRGCSSERPSPPYSPQADRFLHQQQGRSSSSSMNGDAQCRVGESGWQDVATTPAAVATTAADARRDGRGDTGPPTRSRSRSRSVLGQRWRDWIPSNVVGFGIDTLKGWRIGQPDRPNIGSVVPIVADPSSAEGLAYAKSTVNAYCHLHNLALRGIIVVPSILGPRYVVNPSPSPRATFPTTRNSTSPDASTAIAPAPSSPPRPPTVRIDEARVDRDLFGNPAETSRAGMLRNRRRAGPSTPPPPAIETSFEVAAMPTTASVSDDDVASPPMSPETERASRRQDEELNTLRAAIKTDLGDSAALVHALFPALKQGRGRVLALIPSGFGVDLPDDVEFLERFGQRRDVVLASCHPTAVSSSSPISCSPQRSGGGGESTRSPGRERRSARKNKQALPWPPSTRTTVREALETMWTSLTPEYAKSGVAITLVQTPPLLPTPLPACPLPLNGYYHQLQPMAGDYLGGRPRPWKFSLNWWLYYFSERGRLKLYDEPPYRSWFDPPSYAPYLASIMREIRQPPLQEYPFVSDFPVRDKGTHVWLLRKLARLCMEVNRLMQPFDSIELPPPSAEPGEADTTEDEAFLLRHSDQRWTQTNTLVLSRIREQRKAEAEEKHREWEKAMEERRKNDEVLFEVLRKSLQDRPRRWYPVGLAARVDRTVGMLPGARQGKRWLREVVDF